MEYFGILGRLVPLSCASSERVVSAARYVSQTTLEGRRRVQVAPASPRTWEMSWGLADPQEMAALSGFTTGAWGPGPFHWVPIQAQKWNLLTPREATLLDRNTNAQWTEGGPVVGVDGTLVARSMLSGITESWRSLYSGIPCIPGVPVTWTADIAGDGAEAPSLVSAFFDAEGERIGAAINGYAPRVDGLQRVSLTQAAPEGAVSFRAGISYRTKRIARPQVTWTHGPVDYAPGHGCRSAVLDAPTEDLLAANSFGTWSTTSFTVMEVG